jgi:hypothetical protein
VTYTAEQLASMKARELVSVGREFGLKFTKNHNAAERRKRILTAQAERALSSISDDRTQLPSGAPLLVPPKPEFEKLVGGGDTADVDDVGRGGAREGAGRPPGMTDAKARMNNLPQQPNPAIEDALELLFAAWARGVKCPEVCLTKDEARELALPWTQLLSYFGADQKIPPWIMLGITCAWTTANTFALKARLARQAAAIRKAEAEAAAQVNPPEQEQEREAA